MRRFSASGTRKAIAGLPPNVVGGALAIGAALCMAVMTTIIKYTGEDYSPLVQTFYRQSVALVFVLPVILRKGRGAYRTTRPGLMLFRALAVTASMLLSYYAYAAMPLVTANALAFTRVLWLVPLAVLITREKVGLMRVGATLVGFLGVLTMLGPDLTTGFSMGLPTLQMLGSALLAACTVTGIKVASRETPPLSILMWATTLLFVFSIPGFLLDPQLPRPFELFLMGATGVIGLASQGMFIKAMSIGDASAIAPLDYSRLVFAAILGFLIFNEVPTVWTLLGAAVIVGASLAITFREMHLARRAAAEITDQPET